MRHARHFLLSWSLCFLLASAAVAQVNTGRINGTVMDNTGAVLTTATVTVTNPDTGTSQPTKTNNAGEYNFPFLPPASYNLRVEASGFATQQQKAVVLAVGQVLTLNFTLKPGAASEVIEVTGEAPLIETSRSEIGSSVTQIELKELPILDRNFASLMALVPGVRPAPAFDPTKTRGGNVTVNGIDGRAVDYNVDGGDNRDSVIGGLVQNFTVEGIQEFRVVTDRYSAESGRSVGAVVDVVSKTGTNRLHGSGFGEFQNNSLNAASFFDQTKPVYHRYHFGGSVGGPVVKDKLFFFGAYEHKRELASFSADPTSLQNLQLVPLAHPATIIPTPFHDHLLTVKVDHKINNKQSMFYRYGRERWSNDNDQLTQNSTPIADLSETNTNTNQFHSFVIQHNYTLSNTKVNVINLHFQDFVNSILPASQTPFTMTTQGGGITTNPSITFPAAELGQNTNIPQQTLIRKYQLRDDFSWLKGKHGIKFGANWLYVAKMGGYFRFTEGYQLIFADNPVDILGSKAALYPQGLATPGAVAELLYTAGPPGDRTDQPGPTQQVGLYFQDDFRATSRLTLNLGLRWDVNANILPPQLTNDPNSTSRTTAVMRQLLAANPTAANAQEGMALVRLAFGDDNLLRRRTPSWKEFQPRVGFAWDPTGSGKHVIRGGYGISRDLIFQNLTLFALQQTNPIIYQTIRDIVPGDAVPDWIVGDLANYRFGVDPLPPLIAASSQLIPGANRGRAFDLHMTDPWGQQMSIGWAWQFSNDWAFSTDYYHVLGTHEPRVLNLNPRIANICDSTFAGSTPSDPRCVNGASTRFLDAAFTAAGITPPFAEIRDVFTSNRSRFDSVNMQVKKRMSNNFMMQASYVLSWARSWGGVPTSSYSGTGINIAFLNQFRPNEFGPSVFDQRHRFVLSGVYNLPGGFQVAPIIQASSAQALNFRAGTDVDGDGRGAGGNDVGIDRVCVGSTITSPIISKGCQQVPVNSLRGEPFFEVDTAISKRIKFGERANLQLFWQLYNLTNRFNPCANLEDNAGSSSFLTPKAGTISNPYCGGTSGPFRSQYGLRFEF